MWPTLRHSDQILVFKLPYVLNRLWWFGEWQPVQSRDIIVFKSPEDTTKQYVKRVIAVGPPRQASNNTVDAEHRADAPGVDRRVPVRIEEGRIYVNNQRLNENYLPPEAVESRETQGEVLLGPGEVYVLGDNRAVSRDSRNFLALPQDLILGKALFRFWPLQRIGLVK